MMTKLTVLLLAVLALGAQQPSQNPEERIPAGHYCKRVGVPIGPREKSAHSCDCKYSCSIDKDGNVSEHEDSACLAYCHKDNRRCTCHVEEPCEPKGGLVDMDGRLVGVARRRQ